METTLIHADGRVLAAVDFSRYATSVADYAGWAAARLGAPLELLHVLDRRADASTRDLSGSLSPGAREELLTELAALDERRAGLAQKQGRELLDGLCARAAGHGVEPSAHQRHGAFVETLLELEGDVRLFVIGKRGEHADFANGHLGSNLERVMRAVHRPVLVASRAFRSVARFLIAFDGSATTRRCVEMVCASPLLKGMACHVLMVGAPDDAQQAQLQWAQATLREAGFDPQMHVAAGTPDTVIAAQVDALGIDLLVMGAYGHSRIRALIVGSTTTQVLRHCAIPVLLLR